MLNPLYVLIILSLLPLTKNKFINNILFIVISLMLGLFICDRELGSSFGVENIGNDDAYSYVELAQNTQDKTFFELFSEFLKKPGGNEPIYVFFLKTVGFFVDTPLAIYFPIVCISFFILFKVAEFYESNPFFVVLVFLSLCQPYFLMLFTQWRFLFAFSVIIFTVSPIAQNVIKNKKYFFGAIVAGFIHITSVFIIFHFYMLSFKNKIVTLVALFFPIALLFILREYGSFFFSGKIEHYSSQISEFIFVIPSGPSIYLYIFISIVMIYFNKFRLFSFAGYGYLSISQLYFLDSAGAIGTFAYRLSSAYASILCFFCSIVLVKKFPQFRLLTLAASIALLIFSFKYGAVSQDWREIYSKVGSGFWYLPVFPIFLE